jgi:hypothetical protein
MDRRRVISWDPEKLQESEWAAPARTLGLELVCCADEAALSFNVESSQSVGLIVHLISLDETVCRVAIAARAHRSPLQLIFVTRTPRKVREELNQTSFSAEVLWHPACPIDVLRRFASSCHLV